ncbi:2-dehydro-3-deoxy-6-phosphogalactonate aldolase [Burkholderiaceae bacterium UC74_6]
MTTGFNKAMKALPLVAILRGVRPEEVEAIGAALYAAGFRLIEVPLNSPEPLASIEALSRSLPADAVVGAGTVLTPEAAQQVKGAGGQLLVMPHCDPALIRAAKALSLIALPGVATPSEAFAALAAGADALKLFPAEMLPPPVVKALRAVLPPTVALLPVGGIAPQGMAAYRAAGANGFGLGSALYAPGYTAEQVAERAQAFARAWHEQQR